jgi:hypothetical protein
MAHEVQPVDTAEPMAEENVPAGQLKQLEEPVTTVYVPAEHLLQEEARAAE